MSITNGLVRWSGGHFHNEFHLKTVNAKFRGSAGRFDISTEAAIGSFVSS
jgi:hypothetical protein